MYEINPYSNNLLYNSIKLFFLFGATVINFSTRIITYFLYNFNTDVNT